MYVCMHACVHPHNFQCTQLHSQEKDNLHVTGCCHYEDRVANLTSQAAEHSSI